MRTSTIAILTLTTAAGADVVEDQNGLATQLFSGIAVVSSQACSQVVTTGIAGTLDSFDLQIWKSPGAVNDVTIHIVSTTGGVPDPISTGTLFTTSISVDDLPTFDGIPPVDILPLTNVDVSAGGLEFNIGDQFAIAAVRVGAGAPPWVLWGRGTPAYEDGDGFISNNAGETWSIQPTAFTFRTFVDEGGGCAADCNDDGQLNILDFVCFQGLFVAGDPAADCNDDGLLNILDFVCFQGTFVEGCP
jgi:hypothetical protein